jgi:hypothetical protein
VRAAAATDSPVATDHCLAAELLPPGLGLPVVHDEIGVAQVAGRAELERRSLDAPVEDEGRVAEGQKVTATGTPPTSSLTISCHVKISSGYARASSPISSSITGSRDFRKLTSPASRSLGSRSGGIPSFAGASRFELRQGKCELREIGLPADL